MRIYEFLISPDDSTLGMSAISLVDKPAMESEFIAFNKTDVKPKYVKFQDEAKRIVAGLALIPDKLVYRVDEESGEEYFGFFSADTIEMIRDKFMADAVNGVTKNVNLQHNSNAVVDAYLVESFILRTPEMVDSVKAMGIEDAVLGAWFVSYKFSTSEAFQQAISGGFTGFSIEIMLQKELKLHKNNNKINNNLMTKVNKFIDKFKTLLDEMQNANTFEDAVVPESGMSIRWGDVGTPVLSVTVDEAGQETTAALPEGDYIIEDGRIISVDANGNLVEIKDAGTEVAPAGDEVLAVPPVEEEVPAVPAEEIPAVEGAPEEVPAVDASAKTLGEIVDVTKDGEYYITVSVQGGQIVEAYIEVEQSLVKAAEFQAVQAEVVKLKEQLAKPVAKPAIPEFTEFKSTQLSKEEKGKMNNLQLTMHRLNLK